MLLVVKKHEVVSTKDKNIFCLKPSFFYLSKLESIHSVQGQFKHADVEM